MGWHKTNWAYINTLNDVSDKFTCTKTQFHWRANMNMRLVDMIIHTRSRVMAGWQPLGSRVCMCACVKYSLYIVWCDWALACSPCVHFRLVKASGTMWSEHTSKPNMPNFHPSHDILRWRVKLHYPTNFFKLST